MKAPFKNNSLQKQCSKKKNPTCYSVCALVGVLNKQNPTSQYKENTACTKINRNYELRIKEKNYIEKAQKKKKMVDMIDSTRVSLKDTASSRKPATFSSHIKSEEDPGK